jgi:hypothetical protein
MRQSCRHFAREIAEIVQIMLVIMSTYRRTLEKVKEFGRQLKAQPDPYQYQAWLLINRGFNKFNPQAQIDTRQKFCGTVCPA